MNRDIRHSMRGSVFVTGLSCAGHLVALGYAAIRVAVNETTGKASFIFQSSPKLVEDAERYQASVRGLVEQAEGRS